MSEFRKLLKKSGYSSKAIEYYLNKVNVGRIKNPSVHLVYTGICGDTVEIYLKIESNVIRDAKFQAIGCVGAFSSASALMEMVKEKTLEEVEEITEKDVINFLGGLPKPKIHCTCLVKRTLQKAIEKYRDSKSNTYNDKV